MLFSFTEDARELWLDTPEPPRRFDNIMYNAHYFTMIDHMARGTGKYMTDEGFTCCVVAKERLVYVRDEETGEFHSASYAPCWVEPESYRCGSGLNYQIIENVTNGIKTTWRIYIPAGGDPIEVWDLRVENVSGRPRKISLFTAVNINCNGTDLYGGPLYRIARYDENLNAIYVCQDAPRHAEIDMPIHNGFFTGDRKPAGYDANWELLIGEKHSTQDPQIVLKGQCDNTYASMFMPSGTFQLPLELADGASEEMRFLLGACSNKQMVADLRERYLGGNLDADPHFDTLQAERAEMTANIRIDTGDEKIDTMLNDWVKQQVHFGATHCRWGYKGYRDIVQQAQGIVTQDPALTRTDLLKACRHQYADGFALRGWHPLDTMRYSDSAQWMISAFSEYVKETGDLAILDEDVPFLDEGSASVYEHLMRAMQRLHTDRGPHDMCLAFFGDWNDSLTGVCREGKGESVWMSMAFCRCAKLMQELAEHLGKDEDAQQMADWHAEMAAAINTHAWDGKWYLCAIDDFGEPIGSEKNEEGRIFLNMQSWAQLGKVCDDEKWATAWAAVQEHLDSGWGLTLNWPTYTKPQDNIGRLSYLRPGICENGSVYTHGNAFMLLALLERGLADEALKLWHDVYPGNDARPVAMQPNVFANGYLGPDSDITPGRAEHTWITGSASWMFMCVYEYMLGLRRTFDGIVVKPCLPSNWPTASIKRTFRGTTYNVTLNNPNGNSGSDVEAITVDGKDHPADAPLPIDGSEHEVIVTLA